eukprot:496478-Pyramimonas_sp.AAC.1
MADSGPLASLNLERSRRGRSESTRRGPAVSKFSLCWILEFAVQDGGGTERLTAEPLDLDRGCVVRHPLPSGTDPQLRGSRLPRVSLGGTDGPL